MKRYFLNDPGCEHCEQAIMDTDERGEYVEYEDVEPIIADRDIKAANLQLLVGKVLAYHDAFNRAVESGYDEGYTIYAEQARQEAVELARGLKQ